MFNYYFSAEDLCCTKGGKNLKKNVVKSNTFAINEIILWILLHNHDNNKNKQCVKKCKLM